MSAPPDPFALPPPSTSRLRLLFLTVGAGTFFAGYWFLVLARDNWGARNRACAQLTEVADFLDCSTRILVLQALVPLAGPAFVAVLVLLAHVAAPSVITFRYGAERLEPWPAAFQQTVEAADLRSPPVLMLSDRGMLPWMFTYGRRPHHRIMLARSIGAYAKTDPSMVTATLAHELGHLRNRDVDRTYLGMFAVTGFALLAAVPMALSATTTLDLAPALAVAWRTAVVCLLVTTTFTAVIRTREHDADVRAGQFRREDMLGLLSRGRQEQRRLLRLHPRLDERLKALRDPGRLLRPSIAEAVTAGIAAGVIVTELGVILHTVLPVPPLVAYWVAGFVVAMPVTGVAGLGVWRGALVRPHAVGRALASGFAFGAGLLMGAILAPRTSVQWTRWLAGAPDQASVIGPDHIPPGTAIWMAAAILLLTTAVFGWLALAASAWLPRSGPRAWRYAAPFAAVLFGVVMGTWFVAARLAASERWSPQSVGALVITPQVAIVLSALTMVALLALWPLALRAPFSAVAAMVIAVALLPSYLALSSNPIQVTATVRQAALPDSTQAGAICLGLYIAGIGVYGDPGDHAARQRLGRLLRAADDTLLNEIGEMFLRSANTRSQDLAALAWTAFVRRCDHLNRYHDKAVSDLPPPFPTEGW
ncbi:M48 family metalloprotease [Nonomuraea angiospora]|uniref:M48 family metalloprotease n=1 Tax=Nonomuraea angiospora TaxID=46172 RepID=UPI00344BCCCB